NSVSAVTDEPVTRVRLAKEESLDLSRPPKDKISSALNIYYEEVINARVEKVREDSETSRQLPKLDRAMPIVLSGGTAKPRGFLQKFEARSEEHTSALQSHSDLVCRLLLEK